MSTTRLKYLNYLQVKINKYILYLRINVVSEVICHFHG